MKINHEINDNARRGWRSYPLQETIGKATERKLRYIYYELGRDIIVDEPNNILYIKDIK